MPWAVWRLCGCRPMAFAQVGRQVEGSAGDRGCQLVSPGGACPGVPQAATCGGRAEPEANTPGGILAEVAAVEGVRTREESLEDTSGNQARRAVADGHRPSAGSADQPSTAMVRSQSTAVSTPMDGMLRAAGTIAPAAAGPPAGASDRSEDPGPPAATR